jgi:hypothetical protein
LEVQGHIVVQAGITEVAATVAGAVTHSRLGSVGLAGILQAEDRVEEGLVAEEEEAVEAAEVVVARL